jgi:hypothetical protein
MKCFVWDERYGKPTARTVNLRNFTVFVLDTDHLQKVPGLVVESWV